MKISKKQLITIMCNFARCDKNSITGIKIKEYVKNLEE